MPKIKFNDIFNTTEFEDFGCNVVQIREGIILEKFLKNHDKGCDGRYFAKGNKIIVQCKRYTTFANLYYEIKNIEILKIKKLNPQRYILVLSLDLSVNQKEKILNLLEPYIKKPEDIITAEDINNYLQMDKFNSLKNYCEEKFISQNVDYFKLINQVKDPKIINYTKWLLDDLKKINNYFIETKVFNISKKNLLNEKIIILTGDPGSGKTTSGKMLVNYLIVSNLVDEVYSVKSTDEILRVYDQEKRQAIFFDDFWGSTFSFLKHDFKDLTEIIQKISESNSYLILTTREYVLNQGLKYFKEFNATCIEKRIFYKNCDYTKKEKLEILYKHFFNSNISFNHLSLIEDYAMDIINSINYSPRAIHYFISRNQDKQFKEHQFFINFINYLKDPYDYFDAIFNNLTNGAQLVAYVLAISNPPILITYLKESFQRISKKLNASNIKASEFEEYLQELMDMFLDISNYDQNMITFSNHSIHDFINKKFVDVFIDYEEAFVSGISYFNQYCNLLMEDNIKISLENLPIIFHNFIKEFANLKIINDDDLIECDFENEDNNPELYLYYKIWLSLLIYEKYKEEKLAYHLKKEIMGMFNMKKSFPFYENRNFIYIPEIIKRGIDLGLDFPQSQVISLYINNCDYLYSLTYVWLFPKSYYLELKKQINDLYPNLKNNLTLILVREISFIDDEIQIEIYLKYFLKLLKILNIPLTKEIKNIINEYKLEPISNINEGYQNPYTKVDREKKTLNNVINRYQNSLYMGNNLDLKKLNQLLLSSQLSTKTKNMLKNFFKNKEGIFALAPNMDLKFAQFIINFLEIEENKGQEITLERSIYVKILSYLQEKILNFNFLLKYAYDSIIDNNNSYSLHYLLNTYHINEQLINTLMEQGILVKNYNIISFSDALFPIFLSVVYIKDQSNFKFEDYQNYFLNSDNYEEYKLILNQEFNFNKFNKYFLIPLLKDVLHGSYAEFNSKILDITIFANGAFSFSLRYFLLLDYILLDLLNTSIIDDIINLFTNSKILKNVKYQDEEGFNVLQFYLNYTANHKDLYLQLNKVCQHYFEEIKGLLNTTLQKI